MMQPRAVKWHPALASLPSTKRNVGQRRAESRQVDDRVNERTATLPSRFDKH